MNIDTTDGAFWETFRLTQYAAVPTAIDFTQPHDTTLVILLAQAAPKINLATPIDTLAVAVCGASKLYIVCRK